MIEDYNYIDIANVKIDRGWLFCTVSMKERFEGHDMVFEGMPKAGGEAFVRIVTDQIQRRQGGVPLARQPQSLTRQPASPAAVDSEALQILRRRLAAGEITPQEYEHLRRQIDKA